MSKHLFGVPVDELEEELKWGIGHGEHVAHIYPKDQENMVEIPYSSDRYTEPDGYAPVSDKERFDNCADTRTAEFFMTTAKKIAELYESEEAEGYRGEEFKKLLEQAKNYLTAGSRSSQQAELKKLKTMKEEFYNNLTLDEKQIKSDLLLDSEDISDALLAGTRKEIVDNLFKEINEFNNGTLEDERKQHEPKPKEPSNTKSGAIGMWIKTDEALFPHEPSPNDIKQGYGVENCFMLSVVASKAAKDPDFIRNMMKDNGDGTVTVRFFDKEKKPVYIDVQKTVNKGPVGNNVYSSGALWVQMLEKAYAQYATNAVELNRYQASDVNSKKQGFAAIDRGNSAAFLNAIEPEQKFQTRINIAPFIDRDYQLYDFDEKGNEFPPIDRSEGYLKYEEKLFEFMSSVTLHFDETLTVGTPPYEGKDSYKNQFLKNRGIRTGHAYSVMKVFEKEVNGQTKKFVQLRDPYATFKAEYNEKGELVENSYGGALAGGATMLSGIANAGTEGMGTFNLEFTDFLKCFKQFTGISVEREKELKEIVHKVEIVNGESHFEKGKPVYEYDNKEEFIEEIEEKRRPFSKEEEIEALKDLNDDQKELYEKLSDPQTFKDIAANMKECAADLRCTDDFFTAPNSKEFNKMRDATYSLSKMMNKTLNPKDLSLKERMYFVNKLEEVGEFAKTYNTKKINDMRKQQAKGKMPSDRFAYRLGTSMNLINIARGGKPIANTNSKTGTGLGIMLQDIKTKIDLVNNDEFNLTDAGELKRMSDMVEVIDNVCQKNEKIRKDAKVTKEDLQETQEKIKNVDAYNVGYDYDVMSIDDLAKELSENVAQKNKTSILGDFTNIEAEMKQNTNPEMKKAQENEIKHETKASKESNFEKHKEKKEEKKEIKNTTKSVGSL